MTTIAWDGKILAADKQSTHGSLRRTVTKIARAGLALVGAAGQSALCAEMIQWVQMGAPADKFPERQRGEDWVQCVMVTPDGKVWLFCQSPTPILFEDPTFAMGSGRDYAMAVMYLGLPADKAVAVACHFDSDSGMGIDTLELELEQQPPA